MSALILVSPSVPQVHAFCDEYDQSGSWTPAPGATITISGDACAGANPSHAVHCSSTSSDIQPQSGSYTFEGVDYVSPNTGTRYSHTFNTGLGVCPNDSKTYGPFSGDKVPNCAYSDVTLTVKYLPTGETTTIYALAVGRTTGSCPV